ncbi:MAG: hypothetical protein KAW41_03710 [Candidatus Diapherotrites archaeon]|nr:hypothetical protein [Candidatus Diapherotrites archaeon]
MKANMFLIGSILLMAMACAASLDVQGRHVFEGEEFAVVYSASAPISQHEVSIAFADQTRTITLPTAPTGTYSNTITFTAPQKGTYEVVSGEAKAVVEVEPALLVLEDVRISPESVSPGEAARLGYTVRNDGDMAVYNVKSRVGLSSDRFDYNADEQELFSTMAPGEQIGQVKEIRARQNAGGEARIQVVVSYEYDGETHTREEWATLSVSSMDLGMIVAGVLVVVAAFLVFSKSKKAGE